MIGVMPKTNHERNFKDTRDYATPPGNFTRGKHGAAQNRRGAKKFTNSRNRFHENMNLRKYDEDMDQPIDLARRPVKIIGSIGWNFGRSKLRRVSGDSREPQRCTQCGRVANLLIAYSLEEQLCKGCNTVIHGKVVKSSC
jgi:hypothetical protein